MDYVRLELDPDVDDVFIGGSTAGTSANGTLRVLGIPIEAKLRSLSLKLLYEVLQVQKLSLHDLGACLTFVLLT